MNAILSTARDWYLSTGETYVSTQVLSHFCDSFVGVKGMNRALKCRSPASLAVRMRF
jgi:hypothetical protein